jgi:ABC-type phosphate/phosphonate transport system substrate-binding protein
MYEVGPSAARAWRDLFEHVFDDAGVDVEFLTHRWPQPIASLWREEGLMSAFMCGRPFAHSQLEMQVVAAPVPSPPRYESKPRYCSDYLAREGSGWSALQDAFGARFGWMAEDSQSGFHAARSHLKTLDPRGQDVFSASIGPLGNPRKTLEALAAGEVDVVALDSYYLDLALWHEPRLLEGTQVLGHTPWTPIPLLVAAPGVPAKAVSRVREALLACHEVPRYRSLLSDVLLERFMAPAVAEWRAAYARQSAA